MTQYQREDLRRIVINDISERCDEEIIHELALQFGPVRRIIWPTEQNLSGLPQHKSYCFVDYVHPEDAKYSFQVLSKSNIKLYEKPIRVSHVSAELQQKESGVVGMGNSVRSSAHQPRGLHEVGAKLIVRNVDMTATEFDITNFFQQFGQFAAPPRMLRNSAGNFRGVVILSYKDFAYSDLAIQKMHERVFRDRIISVQYAELEDGSGRLHGSEQERKNAALIQEEERKYQEKLEAELRAARQQNTSWAQQAHYNNRRR